MASFTYVNEISLKLPVSMEDLPKLMTLCISCTVWTSKFKDTMPKWTETVLHFCGQLKLCNIFLYFEHLEPYDLLHTNFIKITQHMDIPHTSSLINGTFCCKNSSKLFYTSKFVLILNIIRDTIGPNSIWLKLIKFII